MKIKNYKPNNFILSLDLYPFDVMVSINQDLKDLKKDLKSVDINPKKFRLKSTSIATTYDVGGNRTLIVFRDLANTPQDYGTISHEFFHVIENVFFIINLPHCDESSEAWAYALAYLIKKFYLKLNEK